MTEKLIECLFESVCAVDVGSRDIPCAFGPGLLGSEEGDTKYRLGAECTDEQAPGWNDSAWMIQRRTGSSLVLSGKGRRTLGRTCLGGALAQKIPCPPCPRTERSGDAWK